jgi:trehalose 6-phosphate phosphatase
MIHSRRAVPHLFTRWDLVAGRIQESRRLAVFLDFDGTLVPIAPRPELVKLAGATRQALQRLAAHPRVTVAVLSGRRRAELLRYIALPKIHYLGLYGWEGRERRALSSSSVSALKKSREALASVLAAHPEIWIEHKRSSFSVHLLAAKPDVQKRVRAKVRSLLAPFRKRLRLFENIRDLEVVPHSIPDKGKAVASFLSVSRYRNALPFYFGDDFSDEPAFAAIPEGVPVLVGRQGPTHARFRLRRPEEVTMALRRLEKVLSGSPVRRDGGF